MVALYTLFINSINMQNIIILLEFRLGKNIDHGKVVDSTVIDWRLRKRKMFEKPLAVWVIT